MDGAHDCGIDGIWTFVDKRYITADAHQFLPSRADKIELVSLQAKNNSGYQETVIENLHFHLPTLLDMNRDEEDLVAYTNAKLLDRTRRFLHVLEELETPHPNVKAKGDRLRRELSKITSGARADSSTSTRPICANGRPGAIAQIVFTETPMRTSLGEGYVCLARLDEYYRLHHVRQ
ncbi:hypothetical protein [Streptomyces chartreusis]